MPKRKNKALCRYAGAVIKKLRLEAGITQEQLAEILDVAYQQVQKYENGESDITLSRLQEFASALNISVTALTAKIFGS